MSWIGDRAEVLASCLCDALVDAPVCFCGVVPGSEVPMDLMGRCEDTDADCGIAYVKVTLQYPSQIIGVQDLQPGNCATGLGFDLEMGIFRCFPIPEDGSSPEQDVMDEIFHRQMDDAEAMRLAITCCTWLDGKDFILGAYTPQGPAGGFIGGTYTLSATIYGPGVLGG